MFVYQVNQFGEATIVGASTEVAELVVPATLDGHEVVEVGDESFARFGTMRFGDVAMDPHAFGRRTGRNAALERVVLPEGIASIGRGAFRGLANLREVTLPSTLVEIRDYAFSCTDVREVALPRSCTRLSGHALRTGPEALPGVASYYRSKIEKISVESGNPAYRMVGPVLCRKAAECGGLEALACPGTAGSVDLACAVGVIGEEAFAGTAHIGRLRVSEGCRIACPDGLLPAGFCDELVIEVPAEGGKPCYLVLAMPDSEVSRKALLPTEELGRVDARAVASAYDAALLCAKDPLAQSRAMLARLADPLMLATDSQDAFLHMLRARYQALCAHFGARSDWEGFELMADAGLIDANSADTAVQTLTALGDSAAASYILGLKRRRFGKAAWDYDL